MPKLRIDRAARAAMLAATLLAGLKVPARAADLQPTAAQAADDPFYCAERRLGYWFYCTKPKHAEPAPANPAPAASATQQLDTITAELRELKARAILKPTPANVTAYTGLMAHKLSDEVVLRTAD